MAGETSLDTLLRSMSPQLNHGDYVFCSIADRARLEGTEALGSFREQEGLTVILERDGRYPSMDALLAQVARAREALARGRSMREERRAA